MKKIKCERILIGIMYQIAILICLILFYIANNKLFYFCLGLYCSQFIVIICSIRIKRNKR